MLRTTTVAFIVSGQLIDQVGHHVALQRAIADRWNNFVPDQIVGQLNVLIDAVVRCPVSYVQLRRDQLMRERYYATPLNRLVQNLQQLCL